MRRICTCVMYALNLTVAFFVVIVGLLRLCLVLAVSRKRLVYHIGFVRITVGPKGSEHNINH